MKTYKLHFIRHGLAMGNLQGIYMGKKTDSPLAPQGLLRLLQLSQEYEYPAVQKVYTGPLLRCTQTARAIYGDKVFMQVVEDITEMDFGIFEGRSLQELKNDPAFMSFLYGGMDYVVPEGESIKQFGLRCSKGLDYIVSDMMKNHIDSAAVVTHGGVINGLLSSYGYPKLSREELMVGNGYGFTVNITPRLWQSDEAFEIMGIVPHGSSVINDYNVDYETED